VAIDASRNRSGGARVHIRNLLEGPSPCSYGIDEVHVWSYRALLDNIPDRPWVFKHHHELLERSIVHQLYWQRFVFPAEFSRQNCTVALNTDAGTVARVRPSVTMSRDMLSYEPGEAARYGATLARLRLEVLRLVQNRSLRFSDCAIFLTRYAGQVIQRSCGELASVAYVPHGVASRFRGAQSKDVQQPFVGRAVQILYISNIDLYKHQWNVVKAVRQIRASGRNAVLRLIGGGEGPAVAKLERVISECDPNGAFVSVEGHVAHERLAEALGEADVFVFASSCENMPNTLIEAMAAGVPIACSDCGPMPEVLGAGGVYFDPEDPESIAESLTRLIDDGQLRLAVSREAALRSRQYSWERCANDTWRVLARVYFESVCRSNGDSANTG
jgi:glycosyltransferase involved in cell wall biosynthesis